MWVPVPTVWRVLGKASNKEGTANILSKQSSTAEKGCSSSLGAGPDANNSSP